MDHKGFRQMQGGAVHVFDRGISKDNAQFTASDHVVDEINRSADFCIQSRYTSFIAALVRQDLQLDM